VDLRHPQRRRTGRSGRRSIGPAVGVECHRDRAGQCTGISGVLSLATPDPHDAVVDDKRSHPDEDHQPSGHIEQNRAAVRSS